MTWLESGQSNTQQQSSMNPGPVLQWLVRYRIQVSLLLLVAAGFMAKARSEVEVVDKAALLSRDVTLRYVGELEKVVSRSGVLQGSTHFQGGLGIGISNDRERNEMLRKLQPVVYVPFAEVLDVSKPQLDEVARAGPALRIFLHRGSILAVSADAGEILSYKAYTEKVEQLRARWMWAVSATTVLAIAYFAAMTLVARRRVQGVA